MLDQELSAMRRYSYGMDKMNPGSRLVKMILPPDWPLSGPVQGEVRRGTQASAEPVLAFRPPPVVEEDRRPPQQLSSWSPDPSAGESEFGSSPGEVARQSAPVTEATALVDAAEPVVVHEARPPEAKQVAPKKEGIVPASKPTPLAPKTPLIQDMTAILMSTRDKKTCFVQFANGRVTAIKGHGTGLVAAGPQKQQLRNIIMAELQTYDSLVRSEPNPTRRAKDIDVYAELLVEKQVRRKGDHISVEDFLSLCGEVRKFKADPASLLKQIRWMTREWKAYLAADPTCDDDFASGMAKGYRSSLMGIQTFGSHIVAGLANLYGLDPDDAPSEFMRTRPYGAAHLLRFLGSCAFNTSNAHSGPGALMLGAIQRDESLSEFVLERVNQILGARTGNVEPEMDKSIGYATAALVLSLPRSKLEQMVVTRAQVAQLVADIKETVQRAVVGATLEGYAGRAPVGVSLNLGTLDADISILGKEFIASPAGGAMSAKFHESLLILLHNAQRLEELAELDADPENLVEWEDRPLIDLLNEHVPANFDAALAISMEQAPAPRTLTIQPGEIKTPANPQQAETHVDAGAATGTQSSGLDTAPEAPKPFRVKRKDAVFPQKPAAPTESNANTAPDQAVAPGGKQPGSQVTNSLGHHHKKGWRKLTPEQRELRKEKDRLFDRSSIARWTNCTPEFLEMVLEQKLAAREAANGGRPLNQGQNLIPQPPLETKRSRGVRR